MSEYLYKALENYYKNMKINKNRIQYGQLALLVFVSTFVLYVLVFFHLSVSANAQVQIRHFFLITYLAIGFNTIKISNHLL